MLNPGWLDAAYMNYAWSDYFRQHQQLQAQQTGGAQPGQTTPTGVGKGNYQRQFFWLENSKCIVNVSTQPSSGGWFQFNTPPLARKSSHRFRIKNRHHTDKSQPHAISNPRGL